MKWKSRWKIKLFTSLPIATVFVLGLFSAAAPAYAKEVKIKWGVVPGAAAYEIVVFQGDKEITKKKLDGDSAVFKADLPVGSYTYQIRTIDRAQRAGAWTTAKAFAVKPGAPKPLSPEDGATSSIFEDDTKVTFTWEKVEGATEYHVEIKQGNKAIFDETVTGTEVSVQLKPENYTWRVSSLLPTGRGPAALTEKKESKPTRWLEFHVMQSKLEGPRLVFPVGEFEPPADGKMDLEWKSVDGASAYEVWIEQDGKKKFTVKETTHAVSGLKEGKYKWGVRAIASVDGKAASAVSPESTAEFDLAPDNEFSSGNGYFAISTMLAPYDYKVVSPATGFEGTTSSSAFVIRGSGEYWFKKRMAVSIGVDQAYFGIAGQQLSRMSIDAMLKTRMTLAGSGATRWVLLPKVGFEMRDYIHLTPDSTSVQGITYSKVSSLGPAAGFDLRKDLGPGLSVGLKFTYFYPLSASGPTVAGGKLTGEASYRNWNLGAQGFYWLAKNWGAGAGVFLDKRSISYLPAGKTRPEQIYTDGTYFFGSLLYSFGY